MKYHSWVQVSSIAPSEKIKMAIFFLKNPFHFKFLSLKNAAFPIVSFKPSNFHIHHFNLLNHLYLKPIMNCLGEHKELVLFQNLLKLPNLLSEKKNFLLESSSLKVKEGGI